MTTPKTLIPVLFLAIFLTSQLPASAAPKSHHKPALVKATQAPFSFVAPYQHSPTLARLQDTLQGRVVKQYDVPVSAPIQSVISAMNPDTAPMADTPVQPANAPKFAPAAKAKRERPVAPDYAERSWVSDLTAPQAVPLAADLADFLARQFNPETTTLLLARPGRKQLNNPFTPELEAHLRQAGFILAASHAQTPQAQLVRYQINALDNGILVQLQTPRQWMSRYYPFNATQALMATHPFSIRLLGDAAP